MNHSNLFLLFIGILGVHLLPAQQFTKVTSGDLVNTPSDSRSVNFVDANRDGWEDIFISNGLAGGENNLLYLNNGDSTFTAVINDPIVADQSPSVGATFGDVDNDGDLDGYVTNWYGLVNQFYTSDSTGNFSLTTLAGNTASFAETASWGDYDRDGFLDLYVTNSDGSKQNFLFRNLGNGAFQKITSGDWVTEADLSRCVNWVDVNGDGHPDLFVTNENNTANDLYINTGTGSFTKSTTGAIVTTARSSMSSSWGDIDNDGDQDLFVANAGFFQEQNNQLYLNAGGIFTEVTTDTVTKDGGCSYGSNFGDFDNDGDLDLVVMNGFCNTNLPNYLYENQGDGTFIRNDLALPNLPPVCSYGGAWGDINNDGFLDLVMANCKNKSANPKPANDFYLNKGNAHNWLKVFLTGNPSNASAIGAKVRIKTLIQGVPTWQMREISAQSGYAGQNSLVAHFGLGTSAMVDSLRVEWPSGATTLLQNVSANQLLKIIEGSPGTGLIEDLPTRFQIECYPNPTNHSLAVLLKGNTHSKGKSLKITLSDSMGNLILKQKYQAPPSNESIQIDLPRPLASGVYHLNATMGKDSLTKRVVIR